MYSLIDMYSVPMPPEDLVAFAALEPSIESLHSTIDDAAAERHSSMNKLCSSLSKDIKELNRVVMKTKLKSWVCGEVLIISFFVNHSLQWCFFMLSVYLCTVNVFALFSLVCLVVFPCVGSTNP